MRLLRRSGINNGVSHLPPKTGPVLGFIEEQPSFNKTDVVRFNYVFPVSKYSPAQFQPGPVYFGGEAAQIGHQPFNFTDAWTAYSTPQQMDWSYKPSYKGTQSAASYLVSQQAMSRLLALRSINSGG